MVRLSQVFASCLVGLRRSLASCPSPGAARPGRPPGRGHRGGSVRIRNAVGLWRALACGGPGLLSLTPPAARRTPRPPALGTGGADRPGRHSHSGIGDSGDGCRFPREMRPVPLNLRPCSAHPAPIPQNCLSARVARYSTTRGLAQDGWNFLQDRGTSRGTRARLAWNSLPSHT